MKIKITLPDNTTVVIDDNSPIDDRMSRLTLRNDEGYVDSSTVGIIVNHDGQYEDKIRAFGRALLEHADYIVSKCLAFIIKFTASRR